MVYYLELAGRTYRVRDEWQALWLARVWLALTADSPENERLGVSR